MCNVNFLEREKKSNHDFYWYSLNHTGLFTVDVPHWSQLRSLAFPVHISFSWLFITSQTFSVLAICLPFRLPALLCYTWTQALHVAYCQECICLHHSAFNLQIWGCVGKSFAFKHGIDRLWTRRKCLMNLKKSVNIACLQRCHWPHGNGGTISCFQTSIEIKKKKHVMIGIYLEMA